MIAVGLLVLAAAEAADRPRVVDAGETVRIVELSRRDAFWRFRGEIVGQVCVVAEPGLVRSKARWYAGELTCADGQPYYFFQVEIERGDFPAPVAAIGAGPDLDLDDFAQLGTIAGTAAEEPVGVVGGLPPLPESAPRGFGSRGEPPAPLPSRKADGRLTNAPVPAGTIVHIVDIGPADLHYAEKSSLIGRACAVTEGPLVPTGDGLYAGRLFCGEAGQRQMYQVAVAPE